VGESYLGGQLAAEVEDAHTQVERVGDAVLPGHGGLGMRGLGRVFASARSMAWAMNWKLQRLLPSPKVFAVCGVPMEAQPPSRKAQATSSNTGARFGEFGVIRKETNPKVL